MEQLRHDAVKLKKKKKKTIYKNTWTGGFGPKFIAYRFLIQTLKQPCLCSKFYKVSLINFLYSILLIGAQTQLKGLKRKYAEQFPSCSIHALSFLPATSLNQNSFLLSQGDAFHTERQEMEVGVGPGEGRWNQSTPVVLKLQVNIHCVSRSVVSDSWWSHGRYSSRLLCPWNSPGKNTG